MAAWYDLTRMKKREFIRAVREAKTVYANVKLTESDCWYIQVVKQNLLYNIEEHSNETVYDARVDGDSLYID